MLTLFRDQIHSLVGKRVRMGRGGPDERRVTLVAVHDDYLSVYGEDGMLAHYPLHHLKSMTELVEDEKDSRSRGSMPHFGPFPRTLLELMNSFMGQKVQVYDHGPETSSGFVFEVGEDFVKLVTGPDEMVHYPFFHIRSVRLARQKKSGKSGSKSGGSKSGGSKSGSGKSGSGKSGSGKSGGGKSGGGKSGSGKSRGGKSRGKSGGKSGGRKGGRRS